MSDAPPFPRMAPQDVHSLGALDLNRQQSRAVNLLAAKEHHDWFVHMHLQCDITFIEDIY